MAGPHALSLAGISTAFPSLTMVGMGAAFAGVLANLSVVAGSPAAIGAQFATPQFENRLAGLDATVGINFSHSPIDALATRFVNDSVAIRFDYDVTAQGGEVELSSNVTTFFTVNVVAFNKVATSGALSIDFGTSARTLTFATASQSARFGGLIDDPTFADWQFVDATGEAADVDLWRRVA